MKTLKRAMALIFVFMLSINIYAVDVNDNDGSAFITKAEFDSLKSQFQSQLDGYNTGIDAKIDSAIAAYLAGISIQSEVSLKSYLNEMNLKFVDSDTLGWPESKLGTYAKYYINLGVAAQAYGTANTLCQIQYLTGAINAAAWKTVNDTNPGIYYYGTKNSDVAYVFTDYITSKPYSSVSGSYTTGGSSGTTGTTFTIPTKTYKCQDSSGKDYPSFRAADDTWKPVAGGTTRTVNVVKSFGIEDTFTTPTLNCVTGNTLKTSDKIYFVESKNLNVPGTIASEKTRDKYGREAQDQSVGWNGNMPDNGSKVAIYNHKYDEIYRDYIINQAATDSFKEDVYYYEGLPIFKNTEKKGTITLKLKFVGSKNTTFVVKKDRFDNTAIPTAGSTTYKVDTVCQVSSGTNTVTLTFEADKDDVYWIKARPVGSNNMSYPTTITTEEIKVKFE